jgi:hypothetical protein
MGADGTDKNKKKIRRLGKKKVFLVAALVAVFVGALGVTAVGEKNYFFRGRSRDINDLVFNNDKNKTDISRLEEAYEEVSENLNITVLKLGYIPYDFRLENLVVSQDRAIFQFDYKGDKIYFIQGERNDSASSATKSDRQQDTEIVENEWMNQEVVIKENQLDNGEVEYEAKFSYQGAYYLINGKMDKNEFVEMVKNINYF